MYTRIIPRDFFNESKLLKCHGKLSLEILEKRWISDLLREVYNPEERFNIEQSYMDGSIFISNYNLFKKDDSPILLSHPLNSKLNYPMLFDSINDDEADFVFDDDGNLSKEFLDMLNK